MCHRAGSVLSDRHMECTLLPDRSQENLLTQSCMDGTLDK